MGGCTVAAWYPITPSSSLCENFIALAEKFRVDPQTGEKRVAIVQAEDELAAIGMVLRRRLGGRARDDLDVGPRHFADGRVRRLRLLRRSAGVIFDVQRAGPSTGLPTRTMQGDVSFAYTLSHGDTKHIVLLPATVEEAYELSMEAFDLADRFQTPVFVLSDLDLGMNSWLTQPLPYPQKPFDRGKVLSANDLNKLESWGRYRDVDNDGIPYRTLPGTNHPGAGYFTRGTGHDEEARYSEMPDVWQRNLDRLVRKHETARTAVPPPIVEEQGHPAAIFAYGTTHHAVVEARDIAARCRHRNRLSCGCGRCRFRPKSPPSSQRHERVYVVEQNRDGQLYGFCASNCPTHLICRTSIRSPLQRRADRRARRSSIPCSKPSANRRWRRE